MLTNKGYYLAKVEKVTHLADVATVDECLVNEVSLLLLGLLSQDVTVVSVMSLDLTRSGERETLLSTGVCLLLWHFCLFLFVIYLLLWQRIYQDVTHIHLSFLWL